MDPDIRRALIKALGILGAGLALCAIGVWGTVAAGSNFALTAGISGTPGQLFAQFCPPPPEEPTGTLYCQGTFRPDGDAPPVEGVKVSRRVAIDEASAVRCDGRECHVIDTPTAVVWASLTFAALAAFAGGGRLLLGLARPVTGTRRPERLALGTAVALAGCALLALFAGVGVGIAGL
ncbi:hypothetical protein ACWGB8_19275 [Kitasatospora sp. NPDC054939]